jgi:hypothetical protein
MHRTTQNRELIHNHVSKSNNNFLFSTNQTQQPKTLTQALKSSKDQLIQSML